MVEPFLVGAALSGFLLGKFFHKDKVIENENNPNVEFIAIKEIINPNQLLPFVNNGKSIFVNVKQLKIDKSEMKIFFDKLLEFTVNNDLSLSKVSPDLLLINPQNQKINIRTLIHHENLPRKLDIDVNAS